MRIVLDTNILTRSIQPDSPQHASAHEAIRAVRSRGDELCLFPQVFYEFWAVCTRPRGENGLGLTPDEAAVELDRARSLFQTLTSHDEAALLSEWERLVRTYQVRGKGGHDARIVAAMRLHGLSTLLTFNTDDFSRYPGITTISPEQPLSSST